MSFCMFWRLLLHFFYIFLYQFKKKKEKVRPPNTLQCDGRFNETLMEMSSCLLPHKWRKRREICWIFNEAESWGLWLHPHWWRGLIMNKSSISFPPQTQPYYRSLEKSKWSTVFFCEIIYGVRVWSLGQAYWVTALPLHQAFIAQTEIMHHCHVQKRFHLWNWKSKIHCMHSFFNK